MVVPASRAQSFRARARKVREFAAESHSEIVKEQLEIVAREYEALAEMIEKGNSRD